MKFLKTIIIIFSLSLLLAFFAHFTGNDREITFNQYKEINECLFKYPELDIEISKIAKESGGDLRNMHFKRMMALCYSIELSHYRKNIFNIN